MKNNAIILFVLFLALSITAQDFPPKHQRGEGPRGRIEQLEKIKLLETLDLDEETSVRFFSRRNDFKEEHKEIINKRDEILLEIELNLQKERTSDEFDYQSALNNLSDIEKRIIKHREVFISSLKDILTIEQIAKFVVFESKFMREVRDALMRRRGFNR